MTMSGRHAGDVKHELLEKDIDGERELKLHAAHVIDRRALRAILTAGAGGAVEIALVRSEEAAEGGVAFTSGARHATGADTWEGASPHFSF